MKPAARLKHLDRIAKELEERINSGRGNLPAMREEWRECQKEMIALEKQLEDT